MAEFLSQDEINCLVNIADDNITEVGSLSKLDIVAIDDIGFIRLSGTNEKILQPLTLGNIGYTIRSNKYNSAKELNQYKVLEISECGNVIVISDETYNPLRVKTSELADRFYKSKEPYIRSVMKEKYLEIQENLDKLFCLTPQEYLNKIKEIKNDYPEIWL